MPISRYWMIDTVPKSLEQPLESSLIDRYQRRIDYLRLSITDRCNLRCGYCMPPQGIPYLPHDDILRYEEIERLARLAVSLGITKIRLTGGEPLVRRGVLQLCEQLAQIPGVQSLSITTNGVLLPHFAQDLYRCGIKRLNVSLDTLKPEKFAAITHRDAFPAVWEGVQRALALGFHPIKINVVVLKGINDDEVEDLARLTYTYPFHVRFIEFMPVNSLVPSQHYLSGDEVLRRLNQLDTLLPTHSVNSNGPARYFRFPTAIGKVGLINPLSHHFCATCNRLRLTAEGKLRTCLFSENEVDLRKLLREGVEDREVQAVIRQAIQDKPQKHTLTDPVLRKCLNRPMGSIGG
jgi:cyclic pyranopterin phosphate synthase